MNDITSAIPVKLTKGAVEELQKLTERPENAGKKLRIGVKGGGCSGMTYVLDFDRPSENDIQFTIDGIDCILDPSHEMYLYGMQIDWQNGLNNRGFTFTNPNASTTCGCGTSFAV